MPNFPVPKQHTPITYLREVSEKGLRLRLKIKDHDLINEEYISHLQKILLEYPYFQTGQLILTKGFSISLRPPGENHRNILP